MRYSCPGKYFINTKNSRIVEEKGKCHVTIESTIINTAAVK
ncbi:hypothetical protein T01_7518 [Trichinella spiralis]|uniref:Uncharacterized protein n=1 Tax=Trichinella spiralis TaxID=6334 RepID=A0A0V0YUB7_TRISP|nr:hypothetical protein T01_7518 [Trichinella spiralis]